ncbi:MAG TPA: magnesium/cobalt efflux protein [Actinobacteria bacterium]|nr:magnesium/cobalt efflux protein [Actinomycetota bacterium]
MKKIFGIKNDDEEESFSELNHEEKDMIRGIVELSETTVKEVMIPRIDVVFISGDLPPEEILNIVTVSAHSRFPVYKDTIDNVTGILYAKDLLRFIVTKQDFDIEKIARPPYFIPESKRINSLLHEFKRRRVHIAIAVDEYGGVSGIVCLEDILEEIVGDIQDEFDDEEEDIIKLDENHFLCDTRAYIEDLNKQLGIELPHEDYDTLGGFVFELFGKIPVKYEKVSYNGINFIIHNMEGHKIKTIKIEKNKQT